MSLKLNPSSTNDPVIITLSKLYLFNAYGYDMDDKLKRLPRDQRYLISAEKAGLMDGIPTAKKMVPDQSVSWGEALTMVINSEGLGSEYKKIQSQETWAERALTLAVDKGYLPTDVKKSINVNEPIGKGELVYLLSKTLPYERAIADLYNWDTYLTADEWIFYKTIQQAKEKPEE